jgi:hypothetical protein
MLNHTLCATFRAEILKVDKGKEEILSLGLQFIGVSGLFESSNFWCMKTRNFGRNFYKNFTPLGLRFLSNQVSELSINIRILTLSAPLSSAS